MGLPCGQFFSGFASQIISPPHPTPHASSNPFFLTAPPGQYLVSSTSQDASLYNISSALLFLLPLRPKCLSSALLSAQQYQILVLSVLITNSYNQFLFHSFLSAPHVSNESSRSSSGTKNNVLYFTVSYNRYLFCAPDDERLGSFETCRAHKNCGRKLIIRIVHLVCY